MGIGQIGTFRVWGCLGQKKKRRQQNYSLKFCTSFVFLFAFSADDSGVVTEDLELSISCAYSAPIYARHEANFKLIDSISEHTKEIIVSENENEQITWDFYVGHQYNITILSEEEDCYFMVESGGDSYDEYIPDFAEQEETISGIVTTGTSILIIFRFHFFL